MYRPCTAPCTGGCTGPVRACTALYGALYGPVRGYWIAIQSTVQVAVPDAGSPHLMFTLVVDSTVIWKNEPTAAPAPVRQIGITIGRAVNGSGNVTVVITDVLAVMVAEYDPRWMRVIPMAAMSAASMVLPARIGMIRSS